MDFTNTDLDIFESKIKDGWKVYYLRYQLQVVFAAQEGILKFTVTCQGQTIGSADINFNTVKYY